MTVVGLLIFALGLICGLALVLLVPGAQRLRTQIQHAPNAETGKPLPPAQNNDQNGQPDQIDRIAQASNENKQLRDEITRITNELQQQIEELMMMQRVDKELSATLDFDNVMMLTMDWAIRRTGASAGVVKMGTLDGTGMYPAPLHGYPLDVMQKYNAHKP